MMNAKALRILFLGTPDFAVASLRTLVEGGYRVVAVVTAPDKPAGRGQRMRPSAVKEYAAGVGLRVLQPERLRDEGFLAELRALRPDVGIVIAFRMLPESVWALPRLGTFNLHASLLPQYRGAAPIQWALINGERETGLTTFLLNHEIDRGALLEQCRTSIDPEEDAGSLHDRLMEMGPALVLRTLDRLAAGSVDPLPQPELPAEALRSAPKLFREDGRIDWNGPARTIVDRVRGLSPHPGAWSTLYRADRPLCTCKCFSVRPCSDPQPAEPGMQPAPGTLRSLGEEGLAVATADGWIAIAELQLEGRRRMSAAEALRGLHRPNELHMA